MHPTCSTHNHFGMQMYAILAFHPISLLFPDNTFRFFQIWFTMVCSKDFPKITIFASNLQKIFKAYEQFGLTFKIISVTFQFPDLYENKIKFGLLYNAALGCKLYSRPRTRKGGMKSSWKLESLSAEPLFLWFFDP